MCEYKSIHPVCHDMGKKSVTICTKCADLNMQLMKAKQVILSLQGKILSQKKTMNENKTKLLRMQNEKTHSRIDEAVG